jgi:hypothetical protein
MLYSRRRVERSNSISHALSEQTLGQDSGAINPCQEIESRLDGVSPYQVDWE